MGGREKGNLSVRAGLIIPEACRMGPDRALPDPLFLPIQHFTLQPEAQ